MNNRQRRGLNRVLSSQDIYIIGNKEFIYSYPTAIERQKADLYYFNILNDLKFSNCLSKSKIYSFLYEIGLWDNMAEQLLNKIKTDIDDIKIEMFKAGRTKDIEKRFKSLNKQFDNLLEKKHVLDSNTKEGFASIMQNQYLILMCTKLNGRPLIDIQDNISFGYLNYLTNEILSNSLSISDIRFIARNEPWRGIWNASKSSISIFNKPLIDLSEEQRTLINVSIMYDNAYQHSECPTDDVFNDDDRFDGWLLFVKKRQQRAKSQNEIDSKLTPKVRGSQEVFITASSKEEAARIYELNEAASRHIIRQRQNMINAKGQVSETELPDALSRAREQNYAKGR